MVNSPSIKKYILLVFLRLSGSISTNRGDLDLISEYKSFLHKPLV